MIAERPPLARAGLALILLVLPASAHEPIGQEARPAPVPLAEAVAHKPTAIPDRIILTFVGDPARTIGVTWRTDPGVDGRSPRSPRPTPARSSSPRRRRSRPPAPSWTPTSARPTTTASRSTA